MKKYFLARHVFFCWRGDAVVFLDLKNDEYSMITGKEAEAFRVTFGDRRGESSQEHTEALNELEHTLEALVSELLRNGFITESAESGKPIKPTMALAPCEHLIGNDLRAVPRLRLGHLLNFAWACTKAALLLRFRHLENVVKGVERRKELAAKSIEIDMERCRELTIVFHRLRALFPAGYLCLFDSFALIEFLARYGVYPNWVFAVRPELWAAHCWVEASRAILNDDVEEAEDYVPILVI